MIKLYSFGPNLGVPDPSPFVLKINAYLRMADIPFKSIPNIKNLGKSPKGKLPFIIDGDTTVADSSFIIPYLQEKFKVGLDDFLTDEQKATAYLIGKSIDENLYWCLLYSRWEKDDTWPEIKQAFFGAMPFPLKQIVPALIRRSVIDAIEKHGMGKHSDEEIKAIAQKSFKSLSTLLGDKPYFFGDQPCSFDATAFAFLSEFISSSITNDFTKLARRHNNLVNYCNRIKEKYY